MPPRPNVSPFPWERLARVNRCAARREASMRARWHVCTAASVARELEALLATTVTLRPEQMIWSELQDTPLGDSPMPPAGSGSCPVSEPLETQAEMAFLRRSTGERITVVTETELLSTVAARLAGRARFFALPAAPPIGLLEGVGSAILVEVSRRLGIPVLPMPREDKAAEPGTAAGTAAAPPKDCTTVTLDATVVVGGRSFPVIVKATAAQSFDRPNHHSELVLGSLPVTLPVVAAWSLGSFQALLGLREGDVWLPGAGWHIDGTGGGRAALISPTASRGPWVDLANSGRVVLREDWAEAPEEVSVTEYDGGSQALPECGESLEDVIADTPVVVRVEVGAATLPARSWLELECGDVLCLERPIGSLATLRVAGRAVAEGELVNVDGELGVRIRRLLTNEATA